MIKKSQMHGARTYKNKQTCLDKFVKMCLYFFMIIVYNKYTI